MLKNRSFGIHGNEPSWEALAKINSKELLQEIALQSNNWGIREAASKMVKGDRSAVNNYFNHKNRHPINRNERESGCGEGSCDECDNSGCPLMG